MKLLTADTLSDFNKHTQVRLPPTASASRSACRDTYPLNSPPQMLLRDARSRRHQILEKQGSELVRSMRQRLIKRYFMCTVLQQRLTAIKTVNELVTHATSRAHRDSVRRLPSCLVVAAIDPPSVHTNTHTCRTRHCASG